MILQLFFLPINTHIQQYNIEHYIYKYILKHENVNIKTYISMSK